MTDLYLLLTPVLALAVLALARFVGCHWVFHLEPVPDEVPFVESRVLGTPRTNFDGWVGMVIHVGAKPLRVTQLGRIMLTASTAEHQVKLVEPAGMGGGADLGMPVTFPIGTTSDSDSTQGFAYATLQPAVVLKANTDYYVVSHEAAMGDVFHDFATTTVTTTDVAEVTSGVFNDDMMPGYQTAGGSGNMYGPVDFKYQELE